MTEDIRIHYGCGTCAPEHWLNFDCSPTLRLQRIPILGRGFIAMSPVVFPAGVRYGDIVRGLPVADACATAAYCSHVLEHLSLEDLRIALRNTFRVLRPAGVFRLVLPDLRAMAERYCADETPDAAIRFMRSTILGTENRPRGLKDFVRTWLGNSRHLWLWDYPALASELEKAGFNNVRRAGFNDSTDRMFQAVERQDRWEHSLGIECRRP